MYLLHPYVTCAIPRVDADKVQAHRGGKPHLQRRRAVSQAVELAIDVNRPFGDGPLPLLAVATTLV